MPKPGKFWALFYFKFFIAMTILFTMMQIKSMHFYVIVSLLQLLPNKLIDHVHIVTDPATGIYVPNDSKSSAHT